MRNKLYILLLLFIACATGFAKVVYLAPNGSDGADGTIGHPFATLPAAYKAIGGGDTICVRGGTYKVTDSQVMKKDKGYAYVFALEKAGTAKRRTCIMGYPGERPVFDFSALMLDGKWRFGAFYLGADYLHLKNFDIVGVPVRMKGHTQSECVSAKKGSHCIVENLAMHDGMAIGYYQTAGADNLILNCDAYNNYDDYSEGSYGGNVDGFGCHIRNKKDGGNVFRGCRAWRNSDDGFDLINCDTPAEFDHCYAFYNGFQPAENPTDTVTFLNAGDGNGFKAGGWGMSPTATKCPAVCPSHYIHHCIAYLNKANGVYSIHHLGGNRWEYNVSIRNKRDNYNMLNRLSSLAGDNYDIDGYGHVLKNNVSKEPGKLHISNVNWVDSKLEGNSFEPGGVDAKSVFITQTELLAPRDKDGNLKPIELNLWKQQ